MQLDAGNFPVPDGFTGVTIDGVSVTNQGPVLVFEDVDLNPGDAVVFTFQTAATIGLDVGTYTNQAYAIDDKWQADDQLVSSTVAQGSVTVQPSAIFDCATIIGQVFRDEDGNGYQSLSERGIPAARISTLVAGTTLVITTDQHGLFHLPCSVIPNQDRGTNVVLKLDPETLPSGYRITTENPRAIRVTRGKTSKANFGASLDRVVRLDLNHCAFVGTSANLNRQAKVGLSGLIGKLKEGRSTLRIAYRAHGEPQAALEARTKKLKHMVAELWRQVDGGYPLDIEIETIRTVGLPLTTCPAY